MPRRSTPGVPPPAPAPAPGRAPASITFFLTAAQREAVVRRLRAIRRGRTEALLIALKVRGGAP